MTGGEPMGLDQRARHRVAGHHGGRADLARDPGRRTVAVDRSGRAGDQAGPVALMATMAQEHRAGHHPAEDEDDHGSQTHPAACPGGRRLPGQHRRRPLNDGLVQFPPGRDLLGLPLSDPLSGSFPLGRFPLGRFPLGRFPLGRFPLGRFPLGSFPLGRFPLGRFPLGRRLVRGRLVRTNSLPGGGRGPLNSSFLLGGRGRRLPGFPALRILRTGGWPGRGGQAAGHPGPQAGLAARPPAKSRRHLRRDRCPYLPRHGGLLHRRLLHGARCSCLVRCLHRCRYRDAVRHRTALVRLSRRQPRRCVRRRHPDHRNGLGQRLARMPTVLAVGAGRG